MKKERAKIVRLRPPRHQTARDARLILAILAGWILFTLVCLFFLTHFGITGG